MLTNSTLESVPETNGKRYTFTLVGYTLEVASELLV